MEAHTKYNKNVNIALVFVSRKTVFTLSLISWLNTLQKYCTLKHDNTCAVSYVNDNYITCISQNKRCALN